MKIAGPESIAVKRRVCALESLLLVSCPEEFLRRLFAKKKRPEDDLVDFTCRKLHTGLLFKK